jgi:hypothetical protein
MNSRLKKFILLKITFVFFGSLISICAHANPIETSQKADFIYLSDSQIKKLGYQNRSGIYLRIVEKSPLILKTFCQKKAKENDCLIGIFDLTKTSNEDFQLELLRLTFSSDLKLMDSEDTNCKSSEWKGSKIVALGVWKSDRKYGGGSAKNIHASWRIDEDKSKIYPISTKFVKCEIREDRN